MTNKTNLLLVAFMAIFLFSCAAEDPTTSSFGSAGDSSEAPKASGDLFNEEFKKMRVNIDADTGDSANNLWSEDKDSVKKPTVEELQNSFLLTKFGTEGKFAALYIKPLGTGVFNSGNADLSYSTDGVFANALANSAVLDASGQHTHYDPRKLLTDEGGKTRMAWSGRVANPPEPSDTGITIGFAEYNDYDSKYSSALGGTSSSYSILDIWKVYTYRVPVVVPLGNVTTYVKSTDGGDTDNATRAWFWFLDIGGARPQHYSTVSDPKGLGFGSGTTEDDKIKEPRYASGEWTEDLNTADDNNTHNNVDPPGKMLFGRKTGEGIADAVYVNNIAVFLSTVVGYNIRTIPDDADGTLAKALFGDDGLLDPDAKGVKAVHKYYMEFDAASSIDAKNDEYDDQRDFPHWGGFYDKDKDLDSSYDGVSITDSNNKVQKFTGILLEMEDPK